jgi:hypothetical protein
MFVKIFDVQVNQTDGDKFVESKFSSEFLLLLAGGFVTLFELILLA